MSIAQHVEAAFRSVAKVNSGLLTLGDREPCDCLLVDGVGNSIETDRGVHRNERFVSVSALKKDVGTLPKPGESASIGYGGANYSLVVSDEDITEAGGSLYTFTCVG